jgi:magnesium chelatase subunit I
LTRAASALAAFENRLSVTKTDICRIAVPSLRHRLRRDPLETMDAGEKIEQLIGESGSSQKTAAGNVIHQNGKTTHPLTPPIR